MPAIPPDRPRAGIQAEDLHRRGRAIPDDVVSSVMTFVVLFLLIYAIGGLALGAMGFDLITSFSESASSSSAAACSSPDHA